MSDDWRDDELDDSWSERAAPEEGVSVIGGQSGRGQAPGRFPLPEDEAGWSESLPEADEPGAEPGSGPVQLPHWTEPPTGEVPRIGSPADEDFDSWSGVSASTPRFRTDVGDWASGDFTQGELAHDDSTAIGALADDLDEEWGPPARGRRRRGRRGRRARRGTAPEQDLIEEPGLVPEPEVPAGPGYLEGPPRREQYDDATELEPEGDVGSRVVAGAVMALVALGAWAAGRTISMLLVMAVIVVCAFELYEGFRKAGYHTATILGLVGAAAMVGAGYESGERGILLMLVIGIVFSFLWYLVEVVRARPTVNIALTLLVLCYVGVLGGFGGALLSYDPGGTGLLFGVVVCVVGADVVAYFAGRSFGRTPLSQRISPNKTLEGLIAGAIAALVLGGLVGAMLHPWADKGVGAGLALGLVVAITAPLGDLVESMLKRDLGVKDLGTVLGGHGGFLDRFDALLFALPASYYLAIELFT